MNRPKVLQLCWDFDPAVSSGMGVISLELCHHLAPLCSLTIVKPESGYKVSIPYALIVEAREPHQELESHPDYSRPKVQRSEPLLSPYFSEILQKDTRESSDAAQAAESEFMSKLYKINEWMVARALEQHFDIIHCHDWLTFPAALTLKNKTGKALVVHVHALEYDRNPHFKDSPVYILERKTLDYANAIIAVSHYHAGIMKKHYDTFEGKIEVVYNVPSLPITSRKEKPKDEKLVAFIGRLSEAKGLPFFLELAAKVAPQMPQAQFILCGNGDLEKELPQMDVYQQLGNQIYATGFVPREQMSEMLALTDVLCMPSPSEPYGLIAAEAAASGNACLISSQSGISEILKESPSLEAGDLEGWEKALLQLLQDENHYSSLVEKQKKAIQQLSFPKAAQQILLLYQKVLGKA